MTAGRHIGEHCRALRDHRQQELDSWTRTPSGHDGNRRTPLDGRFGFFMLPDEEVFVSNFLNHPEQ